MMVGEDEIWYVTARHIVPKREVDQLLRSVAYAHLFSHLHISLREA